MQRRGGEEGIFKVLHEHARNWIDQFFSSTNIFLQEEFWTRDHIFHKGETRMVLWSTECLEGFAWKDQWSLLHIHWNWFVACTLITGQKTFVPAPFLSGTFLFWFQQWGPHLCLCKKSESMPNFDCHLWWWRDLSPAWLSVPRCSGIQMTACVAIMWKNGWNIKVWPGHLILDRLSGTLPVLQFDLREDQCWVKW